MSDPTQNADFLAQQHKYAREKEKADKILARYDFAIQAAMTAIGTLFGIFALLMFVFGRILPAAIIVAVGGVIMLVVYRLIKKRKEKHQSRLDSQLVNNLKDG